MGLRRRIYIASNLRHQLLTVLKARSVIFGAFELPNRYGAGLFVVWVFFFGSLFSLRPLSLGIRCRWVFVVFVVVGPGVRERASCHVLATMGTSNVVVD